MGAGILPAERRICEMAIRFSGCQKSLLDYPFSITQEDLYLALGITGIHLNHVLRELKPVRLLMMNHKNVHVSNWHALSAFCEFDASYLLGEIGNQRLRV